MKHSNSFPLLLKSGFLRVPPAYPSPPPHTPHFTVLAVDKPTQVHSNRRGQEAGVLAAPAASDLICLRFPLGKCHFG